MGTIIDLATREDASWANLTTQSWTNANPKVAEQLSPVLACVDVISSALASLPPRIYGSAGTERTEIVEGEVYDLLRYPNQWQTWSDFIQFYVAQCLLYGNAVAVIREDGSLLPVRWTSVSMHQLSSGRLRYDYSFGQGAYNTTGTAMSDRVIHLRDRSDDGLVGRSRLARASNVVKLGGSLQDSNIALWDNGAFPSGAVRVNGNLTDEQRLRLRGNIRDDFAGSKNRSKVLLLERGMEWQELGMKPHDTETLETRGFTVAEICRLFQVPPPLVQDYSHNTFTNAQTAGQWFARFTLATWARKIEQVFTRALMRDGNQLELDMGAFLRSDHKDRWDAYKIALEAGVLQPDEVKRLEGW